MYQLYNMPPSEAPAPPPRRKSESVRSVVIGLLVACVVVAGGITAFNLFSTKAVPNLASSQQHGASGSVMAPLGQSLTVDGLLVTLTQAQAVPVVATAERGNATAQPSGWLVTFTIQFQNQATQAQNINTSAWTLSAANGEQTIPALTGSSVSSVAPNSTVNQSFTAHFGSDGAGPYQITTDGVDGNGDILGWLFNG